MDAGASVVTFLALALSSAKAIHNVLSAVKDGPQNVQNLANWISQLQGILEQLSRTPADQINTNGFTNMASLTSKCAADIANIKSRLQQVHFSADDRRIGRLWKRLKAVVTEKDLERMHDTVRDYTSMLNVHLSLLSTTQSPLSIAQSSQILELLSQLKDQVAGLQTPLASGITAASAHLDTSVMEIHAQPTQVIDDSLEESISRLAKLVNEKEYFVDSDDAVQLMSDLQTLIDSAQDRESCSTFSEAPANLRPRRESGTEPDVSKELKLVNNLIFSAPSIAINSQGMTLSLCAFYNPLTVL